MFCDNCYKKNNIISLNTKLKSEASQKLCGIPMKYELYKFNT